jgi:tetratricopeptide (TPR) repeat protein
MVSVALLFASAHYQIFRQSTAAAEGWVSIDSSATISTFHFDFDFVIQIGDDLASIKSNGDVEYPDKGYFNHRFLASEGSMDVEQIVYFNTQYVKTSQIEPIKDYWVESEYVAENEPLADYLLTINPLTYLELINASEDTPTITFETLDDKDTKHYSVTLSKEVVENVLGNKALLEDDSWGEIIEVDAWQGVDDLLPYQVKLTSVISEPTPQTATITIMYSAFNNPVTIEPPPSSEVISQQEAEDLIKQWNESQEDGTSGSTESQPDQESGGESGSTSSSDNKTTEGSSSEEYFSEESSTGDSLSTLTTSQESSASDQKVSVDSYVPPYATLSPIPSNQEDLDKALEEAWATVRSDPMSALAYNDLGVVYAKKGRVWAALEAFRRAIELDPDLAWAPYNIGALYHRLKELQLAAYWYRRALLVEKNYQPALAGLSWIKLADDTHIYNELKDANLILRTINSNSSPERLLEELRKKKPLFIIFYAEWKKNPLELAEAIKSLSENEKYKDKIAFFAFTDDQIAEVQTNLSQFSILYLPTIAIVDSKGKIAHLHKGYVDYQTLELWLNEILAKVPNE